MDLSRAFSYIFEDVDWLAKLAITTVLVFLTPFFPFGLVALAVLLGYVVELARNVRDGSLYPLPPWDKFGEKITDGMVVLLAAFVYGVPNLAIFGCLWTLSGSGFVPILACCLVPFQLAYGLLTWPMLAAGVARYIETGQSAEFYRFNDLLATIRQHSAATIQWLALSVVVNLALGFLVITCCGVIVTAALLFPMQGHLLGQYALLLGEKPKRKRKEFV